MVFGFKNKERTAARPMTEEEIRNRLYGSAVGIGADIQDGSLSKKDAGNQLKKIPSGEGSDAERVKIRKELDLLKKELNKTKKKLAGMRARGLEIKKARVVLISFIIFLILAPLLIVGIRHLSYKRGGPPEPAITAADMKYTIQVAVFENAVDAKKFSDTLNAKGYDSFTRKSSYSSNKYRFTIYVGSFKNNNNALKTLTGLKTKERIKDSFITTMPG